MSTGVARSVWNRDAMATVTIAPRKMTAPISAGSSVYADVELNGVLVEAVVFETLIVEAGQKIWPLAIVIMMRIVAPRGAPCRSNDLQVRHNP